MTENQWQNQAIITDKNLCNRGIKLLNGIKHIPKAVANITPNERVKIIFTKIKQN